MTPKALPLLVMLSLLAVDAAAAERYRFRDENGVMVYANSIPPHLVDNGYSVVGDDGLVVRVVPSRAELAKQRAEEEARRERDEANNQRRRADEDLLKLYASPADVEAARDRKLASIEGEIARIQGELQTYIQKKADLEALGAERERAGQPSSPEIYANLAIVDGQIKERERAIEARRLEQVQVRASFARDVERVRLLLGVPAAAEVPKEPDPAAPAEQAPAASPRPPQSQAVAPSDVRKTAPASSGH